MLGLSGALPEAAAAHHEDMCLLTLSEREEQYRLVGAAVAWPSDWTPAEKHGLTLRALYAPLAGIRGDAVYNRRLRFPLRSAVER